MLLNFLLPGAENGASRDDQDAAWQDAPLVQPERFGNQPPRTVPYDGGIYTNLPVVILVFIAFGAGIVLSLLCVLFARLRKSDEENSVQEAKSKVEKAEKKEQKLKEKSDKKLAKLAAKEAKASKSKKTKPEDLNKTQEMSTADLQNMPK